MMQPMENKDSMPTILLMVGGGLAVLGSFLPWVSIQSGFGTISKSGMDGGDGIFTLGAGVLAAIFGFLAYNGGRSQVRPAQVIGIVAALITGSVAIYDYIDITERVDSLGSNAFVSGSVGAGLYTLFVAAALMLAGGILVERLLRAPTRDAAVSTEPPDLSQPPYHPPPPGWKPGDPR
jgi:hypothetical protein